MLISRFEALGLLPDQPLLVGYNVRRFDDGEVDRIKKILFDTLTFGDTRQEQFQFGHFPPYGWVIFPHLDFWLVVSGRKARRFIARFCDGKYERYAMKHHG